MIQYAARAHKFEYLEHGSGVFLPVVTRHLERFSSKEKAPFLRTLSVWGERQVYSTGFVDKLREQWEKTAQEVSSSDVKTPVDTTPKRAAKRRLLEGDPKLFRIQEIADRLHLQGISTNRILSSMSSALPKRGEVFIAASVAPHPIPDYDMISALKTSLHAELKVCNHIQLLRPAN